MTVDTLPPTFETQPRPVLANLRLVTATARVFMLRYAANPILLLRAPLSPVLILIGFHLAYEVSGQQTVNGADATGFLVTAILGTSAWSATVWGSGNAIQTEVYEGTVSSVIAAPGKISAVITGYGLGSMIVSLPALLVTLGVGIGFGARFDIASSPAAAVSLLAVYLCCLCIGLAFGGLFVLSRQSNAMSNFLQAPIYLLAGLFVPRTALPGWLQAVSDVLPLAHAMDALRATSLTGASLADVGATLAATAGTSVLFLVAGLWSLRQVDSAVRRRGTLDLT